MAENYYYSSLSGDEIEQTLLGAVRFNTDQNLTTSQKAAARANIGAGESNSTFKILGYFDTLQDLQEWLQILPEPGDAYGIGTSSPYDIYVWDGAHSTWVNNGPIVLSDALIDDEDISTDHTWSSTKINTEVSTLNTSKQAKITANGILKGNGSGGVSAAVAGTDYLTPATAYSPIRLTNSSLNLALSDIGKTISANAVDSDIVVTLPADLNSDAPIGAEIAIMKHNGNRETRIDMTSIRGARYNNGGSSVRVNVAKLDAFQMVVLKKLATGFWVLFGNVEVVS